MLDHLHLSILNTLLARLNHKVEDEWVEGRTEGMGQDLTDSSIRHEHGVRRPVIHAVKNVRAVENGASALLRLFSEVVEQVPAGKHVQVNRELLKDDRELVLKSGEGVTH